MTSNGDISVCRRTATPAPLPSHGLREGGGAFPVERSVMPIRVNTLPITRPSWDDYFLDIADAVAARADCSRRTVGAVIVKDNRIMATGYNGSPPGGPSCLEGACPRGRRSYDEVAPTSSYDTGAGSCIAVHAEANALLYASREQRVGATLYLTDWPCDGCMRLVRASGVVRIVTRDRAEVV